MRGIIKSAGLVLTILLLFSGIAYAGVTDTVRSWMTGEVIALALSTVLAIAGGIMGLTFRRISRTFKEVGEFMAALGAAVEDKRLTREELALILKEGRDIFEVWR